MEPDLGPKKPVLGFAEAYPITSAPHQPHRDGEVSPLQLLSLSLTPPAKGCLLQPKPNLILSPDSSSLGCGPWSMPPTQDL